MSHDDRDLRREGCGADVAAYALGALEPAEAEAFEHHLKECPACTEELARFGQVVDELAVSAPQYPVPPGLRRRVMRSVRSEPRGSAASRPRSRWVPAGLASATAVALAVVVFAIVTLVSGGSSHVRVVQANVVGSAGTAQLRLASDRAELVVRDFPAPAAGHVYEVWLKRAGGAPEPTRALFSVSAQGAADIGVPGALQGVQEILVTEEPAGGSLVPTHPPVIVGRLS